MLLYGMSLPDTRPPRQPPAPSPAAMGLTPALAAKVADLPVLSLLPELRAALAGPGQAVLQAEPGAGKTTVVPLALLHEPWLAGQRLIMLEPRRLAARAAATRLADLLGEAPGETVGYRTRLDSMIGPRTRIEVVTEGVLTRRLQHDAELAGVGLLIFDEFHERSLHADLGLALSLDVRANLRPDLRLLVMSATLDGAAVARLLGTAPVLRSTGRQFPVRTEYCPSDPTQRLETQVLRLVLRAWEEESGSILVFLPGGAEIRRLASLLSQANLGPTARIAPLFGDLAREAQLLAIAPPPPGYRKIVLATSIAETSLTIEGVRVVVDAGLMRLPEIDAGTGMQRLITVPVSQASADQRRGRAGRLEPGVCYRLGDEARQTRLRANTPPEILSADLAPLVLDLAQWGVRDPAALPWLDPPPSATLTAARDLLRRLGALDAQDQLTPHGRALADLPMHPRLGHMVLQAQAWQLGSLAADLAALLEERDLFSLGEGARDMDLRPRLEVVRGHAPPPGVRVEALVREQVTRVARLYRQRLRLRGGDEPAAIEETGLLVGLAYPERLAQARPGSLGRFRLANGRGGILESRQALARADYLAIAHTDGDPRDARIFLAAPLSREQLERLAAGHEERQDLVRWDSATRCVQARRLRRLGELILNEAPLLKPDPEALRLALLAGLAELGLSALPWTPACEQLRARLQWLRQALPEQAAAWPDWSDAALLATLPTWLGPWLTGMTKVEQLRALDLQDLLLSSLDHRQRQELERLAPTHLEVPTGSRIRLEYSPASEAPVLAVKVQELYGLPATPKVAGGRIPVILHLLSPAQRPVQITRDLAGFWASSYALVRKDLRGRYPRHDWPEDPANAHPSRGVKRRG